MGKDCSEAFELSPVILRNYPALAVLRSVAVRQTVSTIYNLNRTALSGLEILRQRRNMQKMTGTAWMDYHITLLERLLRDAETTLDCPGMDSFLSVEREQLEYVRAQWERLRG